MHAASLIHYCTLPAASNTVSCDSSAHLGRMTASSLETRWNLRDISQGFLKTIFFCVPPPPPPIRWQCSAERGRECVFVCVCVRE